VEQVARPVRWTACVERLRLEGVETFVEVGPGRVLTGLVRRIVDDVKACSVEDPAGLEKTLAALGRS